MPRQKQQELEWRDIRLATQGGERGFQQLMVMCNEGNKLVTRGWVENGLDTSILDWLANSRQTPTNILSFCQAFPQAVIMKPVSVKRMMKRLPQYDEFHLVFDPEQINWSQWDAMVKALVESPQLKVVRLSFLIKSKVKRSALAAALTSVPKLKSLKLELPNGGHVSDPLKEINGALTTLLDRNEIKIMVVKGFRLEDHSSFYEALATNTSLKVLDIPCFVDNLEKRKALAKIFPQNMTLESIPCWIYGYMTVYHNLCYFMCLNQCGRYRVFGGQQQQASKADFVEMLDKAIHYTGEWAPLATSSGTCDCSEIKWHLVYCWSSPVFGPCSLDWFLLSWLE